jgi:hypothetical protein
MSDTRASELTFEELHALTAESLIEQLKAWKTGRLVVLEGETYVKVFPPALLAQAIKFLKDNGIDQPAKKGNKVDTLKDAMPDFAGDNVLPFSSSH